MEDEAEVLHMAHHPDEVNTMEANLKQEETIKCKTVPNQPAGTATSTDIVKKIVARESKKMCPAKISMDQPIGQSKKHPQLVMEQKTNKIIKEQLVKCTPDTWPQSFWVFNEGRS
jgi:hypothetical protein